MDPILAALPSALLAFVEGQLSNDEVSSDEEMLEHFISNGLTEEQARQALTYRDQYLNNIYQLCTGQDTDSLDRLPLPAAHYQLGPLLLRDALLTLTGPAWDLHVDDGTRLVCFSHVTAAPARPLPPIDPDADVQTFPLATEVQP